MVIFSEIVKDRRGAEGLSQAELAKKIDCDPSCVSRWESGAYQPTGTTLIRLLKILNITLEEVG